MSRLFQVTLPDELYDGLRRHSTETGVPIAESVRRALGERVAVVTFLRSFGDIVVSEAADAIERGDHLKPLTPSAT